MHCETACGRQLISIIAAFVKLNGRALGGDTGFVSHRALRRMLRRLSGALKPGAVMKC